MKTLKENLVGELANVESFTVKVVELLAGDPPQRKTWKYSESSPENPDAYTVLVTDEKTAATGAFDLLRPVRKTVRQGVAEFRGGILPYTTNDGATITRRFKCEITYKDPGKVRERKPTKRRDAPEEADEETDS
jgi:hypothetical protein